MEKMKALKDDEMIEKIGLIIKSYISNGAVYLFGSRVKENAKENSDFDIAIEGEEKIPLKLLLKIEDEIDKLPSLKSVDVIDLNRTSASFKELVLEQGIRI